MFSNFILFLIILFVLLIFLVIVKIAIPMYRFMLSADAVIGLYPLFKVLLKMDFSRQEKVSVKYDKYNLEFSTPEEASIEYEKMINKSLEYYDKLGAIFDYEPNLKSKKNELLQICSEVRTMRWEKQSNN